MAIEELKVMPSHIKVDDGFKYDDKYINKLFKYQGVIYFFKERSYLEFPYELFEEIRKQVHDEIRSKIQETISLAEDIAEKALAVHNQSDISELVNSIIDTKLESINSLEKSIKENIDKDLTRVFNSLERKIEERIELKVNEKLKDSYRDSNNKIKMTTLVTMKELGYSPGEISEMSKNGLI